MNTLLKLVLIPALLPVISILIYIYRADKKEREPINFILKILLLGAVFALPCAAIESGMEVILKSIYDPETLKYAFMENTIGVALIEELSKWLVFMIFVWKNDNFDYTFDGIVYAATASLGFAAIENVMYVMNFGPEVSVGRAIFAIPGHTTFGIFMGIYLSRAKMRRVKKHPGIIPHILALAVPTVIHGLYDFLLSDQADAADLSWAFILFVIVIDIISLIIIKKKSKKDKPFGIIKKAFISTDESMAEEVMESADYIKSNRSE